MMEMAYIVNMLVDVILCAVCGDYLLLFALMFGYFVLNLHQFRHHWGGVRKDFFGKVLLRLSSWITKQI